MAGDLRAELHRVSLGQDLGRDAAFVVIAAPNQAQEVRLLGDLLGRPPTTVGGVYLWAGVS